MENQSLSSDAANPNAALITTFCEITSAAPAEALFYLDSHNFDLSSAVSTFLESTDPDAQLVAPSPNVPVAEPEPEPYSPSQSKSQSSSPSRSRSPSPPPGRRQQYNLRSSSSSKPAPDATAAGGSRRRGVSGVRTLSDLNGRARSSGGDADTDPDDEPQEYYTGGEKSGMLVQDPSKSDEVDAIFSQARQAGGVESPPEQAVQPSSSSRRFTGTARLLSGETVSHASPQQQQPPASVMHTITFWRNGFTVEDGPLRRLDDPENASFLESIKRSECPVELLPTDRSIAVHVNLVRKEENYVAPKKPRRAFQGVGRTIGGDSDETLMEPSVVVSPPITTAPPPTTGLVVDQALPSTSIQLRLADGTRMVSRFNYHHTLRDIRGFIDASRPGGSRDYQLQTVGFPPKQLTDLDQTVEQAGLANSVVIQKRC